MIEITDLLLCYGNQTALNLPSWKVAPNTRTLILGSSGSGKSSLLQLIAGLQVPSKGRILVAGVELNLLSAAKRDIFRRGRIGFIFQRLHLLDALSVEDNLLLAQHLSAQRINRDNAALLLKRLGVASLANRSPHELSLGQAQRVAIARALATNPPIVLADEPTAALDDENAVKFIDLLLEVTSDKTLIVATHDNRIKNSFPSCLTLCQENDWSCT